MREERISIMDSMGTAVIGAGYWGPNLIRNLTACAETHVRWVCDVSKERAERAVAHYPGVRVTTDLEEVLGDEETVAVAVSTPPRTHSEIGMRALNAGKHVLIEKPLASSVADAEQLVETADEKRLILMCDHTYCYTPAVQKIRELINGHEVGDLQYFDSVRINLGLVQTHTDVIWDLAPHDLSILDFILPPTSQPTAVSAFGADPLGVGHACIAYLTLPLQSGGVAHLHVNWLSPTKIRKTIIGGSKRMLVWDDLEPNQRLSMYDKGVEMSEAVDANERSEILVSYRTGDMIAPALPEREALQKVVSEFAASIVSGDAPETDGRAGLRIVRMLSAATDSLRDGGRMVPLETNGS